MVNRPWGSQQIAFRRVLRQARKCAGLTQAELSKKLAKPQSYVSKYETGERRLDYLEVKEICSRCKMTIAEFDGFLSQSIINESG
ncbi:helix-turn-helix domain-containing protein [Candidatus Spongiihabitans sp.]|uniref:helix-turn-helix domain-containing protein n=1 Tax=Candidatus Spongiihabitans sp. TaxID=3101308 RepID=UPI003C6EEBDC